MILHHPKPQPPGFRQVIAGQAAWKIPFLALEHICEWSSHLLSNWALVETLEYLGSLSILIAVFFYFSESDNRIKQKHYQAWQVINTAQGKGGSGGRIEALQELAADQVPLTGVDVSGAFLYGLKLDRANLVRANFHNADARNSSLEQANLADADLTGANFHDGSFRNADLRGANLQDTTLDNANLDGADFSEANLENADLHGADLRNVRWQNLQSAKSANIYGVKNAPADFVSWALKHGAVQKDPRSESAKLEGQ